MEKIITNLKENKYVHYSIIIIIGMILSIPLIKLQLINTDDGFFHLLRLMGTKNSLKIGLLPPLIAPYFCNGGGYAVNLFYNPLPTYISMIFYIFIRDFPAVLKLFATICTIISGITMYNFTKEVAKNKIIALLSAILYVVAPYKLTNIYDRFAIGEFTALAFLPVLFEGLFSLFNDNGEKSFYICIGATLITISHTITIVYATIFSAVYVLFNIKKIKDRRILFKLSINVCFTLLMVLFFIIPMLEAKKSCNYTVFDDRLMRTTQDYTYSKAIDITELLGFNEKSIKQISGMEIYTVILIVSTVVAYFLDKKFLEKNKKVYCIFLLFSTICLFISTKLCPWNKLPNILCKIQYPWRILGFFYFFSSLIIGKNFYAIQKKVLKKEKNSAIIIGIFLLIITVYNTTRILYELPGEYGKDKENIEAIIQDNYFIGHLYINRDYLPVNSLKRQDTYLNEKDYSNVSILTGNAIINNTKIDGLHLTADIDKAENGTLIEFPFFFYPGYQATIIENGEKTKLNAVESENGFSSVFIEKELKDAKIELQYSATGLTIMSYIISSIALIVFVLYVKYEKSKLRELTKNG